MDKSNLVPLREAKRLTFDEWDKHTSNEQKWELFDGFPFSKDGIERDRLAICLLYSMGLEHFVELLPQESKTVLKGLLACNKE